MKTMSAQENENTLIRLFSPGTRFTFNQIEYESIICAKPRPQAQIVNGGEPITDMYLKAEPIEKQVEPLILKISLKKIGWEFLKNHMQRRDTVDVFINEFEEFIQNYLEQCRDLLRDTPVIDLGQNRKINSRMGDGSMTLGWEMMITNRNRGLSLGILPRRFVREAVLGEHMEERRRNALVNGDIIPNSGIPTHVLEMNLDENTTRQNVFQTMITSEDFIQRDQDVFNVILKANNYRSLSDKTSSGRCDGKRYLFVQNRWSVDNNGHLTCELNFDLPFEENIEFRRSLEDSLTHLGIDIRNVSLDDIILSDDVNTNYHE